MIFTIFTIITFLAECILAIFILSKLVKLDKIVLATNETINSTKPVLKDICILSKKISVQILELTQNFIKKFQLNKEEFAIRQLSKLILALILWKTNSKFITKLRKTKVVKLLGKGLSLLEIMV
ncbi:MAG: hypothetical protein IJD48_03665 [Clostridia bacterium]|nr:hypothetical protein [Clostridia bacterium]